MTSGTTPEFTLNLQLVKLTSNAQPIHIEANAAARAALASRFGLASLDRLAADLEVSRAGKGALVKGKFEADAVQSCIISGEPLPVSVKDEIALRYEPDTTVASASGQEIELEADALDVIPMDGDSIDVAEAVAQSLLLALDPYPRASEEVLARARRHLLSEEEAAAVQAQAKAESSPFAKLRPK